MTDKQQDKPDIEQLVTERILVLDGAMGTMIQGYKLGEDDYRGERFRDHGCNLQGDNDLLALTQPDIIREIHTAYLEAGADIIETNTFNATSVAQADYQLEEIVYELNVAAARVAREAADAVRTGRVLSPASWGRQTAPHRYHLTSIIRDTGISPLMTSSQPIVKR